MTGVFLETRGKISRRSSVESIYPEGKGAGVAVGAGSVFDAPTPTELFVSTGVPDGALVLFGMGGGGVKVGGRTAMIEGD